MTEVIINPYRYKEYILNKDKDWIDDEPLLKEDKLIHITVEEFAESLLKDVSEIEIVLYIIEEHIKEKKNNIKKENYKKHKSNL